LIDLEPQFTTRPDASHLHDVQTFAEAQGVMFECPKCRRHSILIWFRDRGVPDEATPGPGRWIASGTGYDDLTLSPSINLDTPGTTGCKWHGWVTGGEAK
jgi:hypothetical protein